MDSSTSKPLIDVVLLVSRFVGHAMHSAGSTHEDRASSFIGNRIPSLLLAETVILYSLNPRIIPNSIKDLIVERGVVSIFKSAGGFEFET